MLLIVVAFAGCVRFHVDGGVWSVSLRACVAYLKIICGQFRCFLLLLPLQGASDPTLMVGCGVAPFGRLARAKWGCALAPYFGDGPTIPVSF
jgi:hypothetical protein